jgi:hypothetical protein
VTEKSVSKSTISRVLLCRFAFFSGFNFRVPLSVTFVLCFEMNAGPSTVLALTGPAKLNAMRDIGIESCSEGQKFYFRHFDRLGVLFVRPLMDYI